MEGIERARRYSRIKERIGLFGTALGLIIGALFLVSGIARNVSRRTLPRRGNGLLSRTRFTTTLVSGGWLAGLPLSYLSGYIIEHRFGLSSQSRTSWLADQLKGQAIGTALSVPLVEGLYWTIGRFRRWWWLVVSVVSIPLTTLLAQLYPVLIAPRFNEFTPLEDEKLEERLKDLASKTGIEVAGVMKMDMSRRTSKANAFFAGIGPTKRIVLADTMLENFDDDEIEVIVAHEIAHQANRDIWRFVALGSLFTLATSFVTDRVVRAFLRRWGRQLLDTRDIADIRSLPAIGLSFSVASLLLTPLQRGDSRELERRADAFALALTRNPDAFSSAMMKLAETNLVDPSPSQLRVALLYSHPSISERIARANAARPIDVDSKRDDHHAEV
ncbi:MAG: M48 family metallopeptidase [Thermomicrobiales bacterium]